MAITGDRYYQAEIVPDNLDRLVDRLCAYFGVPRDHGGIKGSTGHRRGYHRSLYFLKYSKFAVNRHYSVDDHPENLRGDGNWNCGIDLTLPKQQLILVCARLDRAVRAGRIEKVAEWYGNRDGDQRVDGFDNIRNVVASSDDTHLWHLHMGILRGRANDNHDDLFAILTGDDEWEDDVKLHDTVPSARADEPDGQSYRSWIARQEHLAYDARTRLARLEQQLAGLVSAVEELARSQGRDPAQVMEAIERGADAAITRALREGTANTDSDQPAGT